MLLVLRVAWLSLPVTAGLALAHGLDGTSTPVQVVASALAWGAWAVGVVAVLVPRTLSLTTMRTVGPASFGTAVWMTARAGAGPAEVVALAVTAGITGIILFVPAVCDAFVDGSSYGPERRFALRTPGLLLLGPVELAWFVTVAGVVAGPLLLAARAWLVGAIVTAIGLAVAHFASRSLHELSRRWIVFVPAGFVLHDPTVLTEPILFTKRTVKDLGPAPADAAASATDLTANALGLAIAVHLREPASLGLRNRDTVESAYVLFTPARPGALMAEARQRRLAAAAMPPPSTTSPS